MTFRADLHCHSTASDGTFSPTELVHLAKETGLTALSITDHDTISAYEEAIPVAKAEGIQLVSGVEFSCTYDGKSVHLLGYDFDLNSEIMQKYCKRHKTRRGERNAQILEKLRVNGIKIDSKKLEEMRMLEGSVGRPHIAQLIIDAGYATTIQETFDRYLAEGKPCYAVGPIFPVSEALEVIKQSSGKSFIAHPHFMKDRKLLRKLLELPFDGIECYYSNCYAHIEARWLDEARRRNMLISGGSDFHGTVKAYIKLGASYVDQETFDRIFTRGRT